MPSPHREFVDADHLGSDWASDRELLFHVEHVHRFDREPIESFLLHASARPTVDAPSREFKMDAEVAARQIAHPAHRPVVPRAVARPTGRVDCFFGRRLSVMPRAQGSPPLISPKTLTKRTRSVTECVLERGKGIPEGMPFP